MIEQMIKAVSEALTGMGFLGIVLALIAIANISMGTYYNVAVCKKPFEIGKFFLGFLKAIIVFISVCFLTAGVTILPLALTEFGFDKIVDPEVFNVFSITAIAALMLKTIIAQGTGAIENLQLLWGIKTEQQIIESNYSVEKENPEKE